VSSFYFYLLNRVSLRFVIRYTLIFRLEYPDNVPAAVFRFIEKVKISSLVASKAWKNRKNT